ncbi:MAG TPA: DUF2059 domain-containing protein [Burkholderiaceae bacterium]
MQRIFAAALLASAVLLAHAQSPAPAASAAAASPAKKALVAKVIALQQPLYEGISREIVMRPAMQLGQQANGVLQGVPADKREAMTKNIDADIRKYIDESVPLLRDRAVKLAPDTLGPILEAKMSEAELKQLAEWLASPAAKKYDQIGGEIQQALGQKLFAEAGPLLTPKLQALEGKVRTTLGLPPPGAAPAGPAASGAAPAPAKPASK